MAYPLLILFPCFVHLAVGSRYYSKVFAVDSAGLESQIIVSNGFVADLTPPIPMEKVQTGDNLISNPSFESIITDQTPDDWVFSPPKSGRIFNVGRKYARDGTMIAVAYNRLSQSFKTAVGSHYVVSFYTKHVSSEENVYLHQEGKIEAPRLSKVFQLYSRPNHRVIDNTFWQKHSFYFVASESMSTISLTSLGDHGMYLDLISVRFTHAYKLLNVILSFLLL